MFYLANKISNEMQRDKGSRVRKKIQEVQQQSTSDEIRINFEDVKEVTKKDDNAPEYSRSFLRELTPPLEIKSSQAMMQVRADGQNIQSYMQFRNLEVVQEIIL